MDATTAATLTDEFYSDPSNADDSLPLEGTQEVAEPQVIEVEPVE
jgi:hypothetical protein